MIVMKFGGTSLGTAEMFLKTANIIKSNLAKKPIVVVSAMSGVTDALISAASEAAKGNSQAVYNTISALSEKHEAVVLKLLKSQEILSQIKGEIDNLKKIYESIISLKELTPRSLDKIASYGEKLSSKIMAQVLNESGVKSKQISAENLIVTDNNFGNAKPYMALTKKKIITEIPPLVEKHLVPVITGFIAATEEGITTTLGRGGSDYSASIIGACLQAKEVQIWTDIDGIMTADPKIVPGAKTIKQLSYKESAELAYFGANVLYPKMMIPAMQNDVPIVVKNTFNPSSSGTIIKKETGAKENKSVKALTVIKNSSLITVEGAGMLGVPGIAAKVFSAVAGKMVNVFMISQSSSEYTICFVVDKSKAQITVKALKSEFSKHAELYDIDKIYSLDDIAIIAAVGQGMIGTPGIAGRIFSTLGKNNINIIAIAQGSSELNISFVVKESDVDKAVSVLHEEFELGK